MSDVENPPTTDWLPQTGPWPVSDIQLAVEITEDGQVRAVEPPTA